MYNIKTALLTAIYLCLSYTSLLALDKVYKTHQDYLDHKPFLTGTVSIEFFPLMKIKGEDGTKTKFNIKEVWGYESDERVAVLEAGNTQKQSKVITFLNRAFGGFVYRCISQGKFFCWVPNTFYLEPIAPGIFAIVNGDAQPGQINHPCCYSTALDSELIYIASAKKIWEIDGDGKKEKVDEELHRLHQSGLPQNVIQAYNALFPVSK